MGSLLNAGVPFHLNQTSIPIAQLEKEDPP
jgi:hypothetical protein